MDEKGFEENFRALTPKPRKVLALLLAGKKDEEIAKITNISSDGVRKHIQNLCDSFGIEREVEGLKINRREKLILKASQYKQWINGIEFVSMQPTDKINLEPGLAQTKLTIDLGDAPDASDFIGRKEDLDKLRIWIESDKCRIVTLLGMAGIGKTCLSIKLINSLQSSFKFIVWRSLREVPSIEFLLKDLLLILTDEEIPDDLSRMFSLLMNHLRENRCLVVLDNTESMFQSGVRVGCWKKGYEQYGELLRRVGELAHQSCFILTSREKPKEVAQLERRNSFVRSLNLPGLSNEVRHLPQLKNLIGSHGDFEKLTAFYQGNPLALQIVSATIKTLFEARISSFLQVNTTVFGDIREVLSEQFSRLSTFEIEVVYWFVVNREPMSFAKLQEDLLPGAEQAGLIEALDSLMRRSLLQENKSNFILQNAFLDFATIQLTETVIDEINNEEIYYLSRLALSKATSKDYVRETQEKLILLPILDTLLLKDKQKHIKAKLLSILDSYRRNSYLSNKLEAAVLSPSYVGGNVINLLRLLNLPLHEFDFSQLPIRQAYLNNIDLSGVNFEGADLSKSSFAEKLSNILAVRISPDSKLLCTGDVDHRVDVWNINDGTRLHSLVGHCDWIWDVQFSNDGRFIASCSDDCTVRVWEVDTGECVAELKESGQVRSIAFIGCNNTIAAAVDDGTVSLWDIYPHPKREVLSGHTEAVFSLDFSAASKILASGDGKGEIRLWNVQSKECTQVLSTEHTERIWSLKFNFSGEILVSGGNDQSIHIFRALTGQRLRTLQGHTNSVRALSLLKGTNYLISGSNDKTVRIWDIETGELLRTLDEHKCRVLSVDSSSDGCVFISSSENKMVKIWDANNYKCIRTIQAYNNQVKSIALDSTGHILAVSSEDRRIRIWNISSPHETLLKEIPTSSWIWAVAFSSNNELLAGGEGKVVHLWSAVDYRYIFSLQGHTGRVFSVAFSQDNKLLASGSEDGTIRLWSLEKRRCIKRLEGHKSWVWSIAISSDGSTLASGSYDCTVRLWDIQTGQCNAVLQKHNGIVTSVAFSPDGDLVATGGDDQCIHLWNVQTGEWLKTLRGHTGRVWSVGFSFDGETLISGSEDQTIRVWNTRTGVCLKSIAVSTNRTYPLLFAHAQQEVLVHTNIDNYETITLLDIETEEHLKNFKNPRPYEGLNISRTIGLTKCQKETLRDLGAIDV